MLRKLYGKLEEDAKTDKERGREELEKHLREAAKHIKIASDSIKEAWGLCSSHVDPYIKNYNLEAIFDPDISRKAKIDGFVSACWYAFRENGLNGLAYLRDNERFNNDPDHDEMLDRLILNLDRLVWDDTQGDLREELYKVIGKVK
jgi:hypothetical protein